MWYWHKKKRPWGARELNFLRLAREGYSGTQIRDITGQKTGSIYYWLQKRAEQDNLVPRGWYYRWRAMCTLEKFEHEKDYKESGRKECEYRCDTTKSGVRIPKVVSREKYLRAQQMFKAGVRVTHIARILGVSRTTIRGWGITTIPKHVIKMRRQKFLEKYPPLITVPGSAGAPGAFR